MTGPYRDDPEGAPDPAPILPSDRWRLADSALWLVAALGYLAFPAYRVLGSQVIITALFALSLDLILGYAGIVSLGHAAFFGLGAYTAGLLAVYGWGEPLTGLVAAAGAAALLGYATSFLVIRGRALGQLMITLGVGLLAQTTQFVGLDSLDFARSAAVLIMVSLGGTGRLYGAFVGAGLFLVMQDVLARHSPAFWQLWLGLLLVAVVLFARGGVLGAAETMTRAARDWRSRRRAR